MEVIRMGIEPWNTATAYQVKAVQKVDNVRKTDIDNKDVITGTERNSIKDPTSIVDNVSDKDREKEDERQGQQEQQIANEKIKKAVEELNKKMWNSEAIFGIHEKTNRVTIKIVNKDTKDVIKEFPPEKTLDMIAKAWELAGLMVDEKR